MTELWFDPYAHCATSQHGETPTTYGGEGMLRRMVSQLFRDWGNPAEERGESLGGEKWRPTGLGEGDGTERETEGEAGVVGTGGGTAECGAGAERRSVVFRGSAVREECEAGGEHGTER